MTESDFNNFLNDVMDRCKDTLSRKAAEYSTEQDRFHNFRQAATLIQCSPQQALFVFAAKHIISVADLVREHDENRAPSAELVNEKIGDTINYLFLLWAMFYDARKAQRG